MQLLEVAIDYEVLRCIGLRIEAAKGERGIGSRSERTPPPPEWLFTNLDQLYMSQLDSSLRIVHKVVVR